ncbi:TipAS antibiotic-recognition domain-containing protein [Lactobacillus sp. ESL0677]|uniref:TipAS antibiotic-recognition domain-containing protein n=1 Tax=Lactobacillus sp. ESL0677 TaxID=2983208 RepID=UPI0023F8E370|nr:TipAS antibiotic-recognition domain-containing protein [Lactobacillus sp. ESL0677]WEV36191.1 TipAS antibiotic-recognition domain-containing protein [Lactobacillus sp. ESL0677]
MTKKDDKKTAENFNKMKVAEANLVRSLQAVVKNPTKEEELSDDIFADHKTWLQIIMPNYSPEIHLALVNDYEKEARYKSYYDDKAGKGATAILVKVVKEHLAK